MKGRRFHSFREFKLWQSALLQNAAIAGPGQHKYMLAISQRMKRAIKPRLERG